MKLRERSARNYGDYAEDEDEIEGRRTFDVLSKVNAEVFNGTFVKFLKAKEVTLEYFQQNGFREPIMVLEKTGLGLKVPNSNFSVSDVKKCVGNRRIVDVMDVVTQKGVEMTMKEWTEYFENPNRDRLLNVISLEVSHTPLEQYVDSPAVVRQIDWVDCAWPLHLKTSQKKATNTIEDMMYPKVQKYCLMSVGGCFTDFHIDFGGSSVWYHVLRGRKVFWLIPPTEENLRQYEVWTLSGKQGDVFLGDKVEKCQVLEINEGNTFLMPSGWIHAVYTPLDSLVFGGNFIHSFNISMQLRIYSSEEKTKVPVKFRYPFFEEMQWYVLERYVHRLTGVSYLRRLDVDDDPNEEAPCLPDQVSRPVPDSKPVATVPVPKRRGRPPKNRVVMDSPAPQSNASVTAIADLPAALTACERQGLRDLIAWVQTDPRGCVSVPHMVKWPQALLSAAQKILAAEPSNEVSSNRFILQWSDEHVQKYSVPAKQHADVLASPAPLLKKPAAASLMAAIQTPAVAASVALRPAATSSSSVRRRRVRCKKCVKCLRGDCKECLHCSDMRKYGGSGRLKKTCLARLCMSPILPHDSLCSICKRDTGGAAGTMASDLRECLTCLDIVHPQCYRTAHPDRGDGIENADLPNSWRCPVCATGGSTAQPEAGQAAASVAVDCSLSTASVTKSEPTMPKLTLPEHASMEVDIQQPPINSCKGQRAASASHHHHTAARGSGGQTALEKAQQRKAAHNLMFGTVNRVRSKYHRFQKIMDVAVKTGTKRKGADEGTHSSPAKKRAINASLLLPQRALSLISPPPLVKAGRPPAKAEMSSLAAARAERPAKAEKASRAERPPVKAEKAVKPAGVSAAISTLQQCHRQDIERKMLLQQHHRSRGRLGLKLAGKENGRAAAAKTVAALSLERHGHGVSESTAAASAASSAADPEARHDVGKQAASHPPAVTRLLAPPSSTRIRKGRCGQCEACSSGNCGTCLFCLDMIKFGGPGRLKQACLKRRCVLQEDEVDSKSATNGTNPESKSPLEPHLADGDWPAGTATEAVAKQSSGGTLPLLSSSGGAAAAEPPPVSGLVGDLTLDRAPVDERSVTGTDGDDPMEEQPSAGVEVPQQEGCTKVSNGQLHPPSAAASVASSGSSAKSKHSLHSCSVITDSNKMAALQKITKTHKKAAAAASATAASVAAAVAAATAVSSSMLAPPLKNSLLLQQQQRVSKDGKPACSDLPAAAAGRLNDDWQAGNHHPSQQLAKDAAVGNGWSDDESLAEGFGRRALDVAESRKRRIAAAVAADPTQDEEIWLGVFSRLGQRDLVRCMGVCKLWHAWAGRQRFWRTVDLSQRHVSPGALAFAVARQPLVLRLGFSDVAPKHLQAALARLASLRALHLNNTSRETVLGALGCGPSAGPSAVLPPGLDTLELAWVPKLDDEALKELLLPTSGGGGAASGGGVAGAAMRLQRVTTLSLRGTDVGDTTLRLLTRCMPRLALLDVSRCERITDAGVNLLTCSGSSVQQTLCELNASSCRQLTSACLPMLKRCPLLRALDLRNCGGVDAEAVAAFVAADAKRSWSNKDKRLAAA